ncbi:MAG: radical SAM-associated putative lipoprotein [Dysgonamonadaceae bacterium]|jgi:putative lipoprotein (rSAM/lipoprotein system)|nr:radical SAM-associated putative lipoprotein [Dysgonamonadaceae bacterium]
MKTINHSFLKGFNWLIAGVLSLLGFSGCSLINNGLEEYGAPHSDYVIKGKVVDSKTKQPVKGIKIGEAPMNVLMYGTIYTEYYERFLPDTTDVNGNFKITFTNEGFGDPQQSPIELLAEDIDGAENGSYLKEVVEVDFNKAVQTKPENGWYNGEYTVNQNIELNPENE